MIDLLQLLRGFGLEAGVEVKLYRHVDHDIGSYRANIENIYALDELPIFQERHRKREFGGGYLVSFIGEPARLSRFAGVWRVHGTFPSQARDRIPKNTSFYQSIDEANDWHDLRRDSRFEPLVDRLVIRWPEGRLSHRWLVSPSGKETSFGIDRIRPEGYLREFPGFSDLTLSHQDLVRLDQKGDGGAGWIEALRSTRGVYLITDTESGELYVGSATSGEGLWGRWRSYARNTHGGNKLMIDAVVRIEKFADRLQFSVLETLSNLSTARDGLAVEQAWKRRLGKRAIILNAN